MIAFVEQGCRFVGPVLIGDTIHTEFEVKKLERKGDKGVLRFGVTVTNQRGETVVDGHHVSGEVPVTGEVPVPGQVPVTAEVPGRGDVSMTSAREEVVPRTPAATSAPKPRYAEVCRAFSRAEGFRALGWTPDGDVDLGTTILDRHAGTGRRALTWFAKDGSRHDYSFDQLSEWSARFASALRRRGVERGDRVAGYLPRTPETLIAMIGAWKAGAIYVPIFTGFGPDAIAYRVKDSVARILCTHWEYRGRVPRLPGHVHILTVARNRPDDAQQTGSPRGGRARVPGHCAGRHGYELLGSTQGRGPADGAGAGQAPRPCGAALHLGIDGSAQGRPHRHELRAGGASVDDARRGAPAGRRVLADRRPGLGLRAHLLHAGARARRARRVPRGGAERDVRARAHSRPRRHQPGHDADAAARDHGARRGCRAAARACAGRAAAASP